MVRRALQGEIQGDLHAQGTGPRDEQVEVLDRAQVRVHGVVATVLTADRPGRAGVVRAGNEGVVRTLAVDLADRVDRGQVDHVEAHRRDRRQALSGGEEGPRARRVEGRPLRAGEHLVPAPVQRPGPVDPDPVQGGAGHQLAQREGVQQARQPRVQGGGDPFVGIIATVVAQRGHRPGDLGAPALRHARQRPQQQPRAVLEVDRELVDVLSRTDLELDAVPPGGDRIGPRLDAVTPQALVAGSDLRLEPVGAGARGPHADERRALAVGSRQHDVGADEVVTLPEHGRTDGEVLAHDRARGPLPTRHDRGHIGDDNPAY